jgi:sulfotransferase family protein
MPEHKILAGAFHKTGTVLMNKVFRNVAKNLELKFYHSKKKKGDAGDWDVAFVPRSRFAKVAGDRPWRAVVCIRDPRDVVISAAHYHCKAPEKWLHRPREEFGGRTYQQAMLDLPSDEERYLFEMAHSAKKTIRAMLALETPPENVVVTRMELLAVDTELEEFRRIFTFLGFGDGQMKACLKGARKASLFGRTEQLAQKKKTEEEAQKFLVHRRSGGRPAQWRTVFTPRVMAAFVAQFGDAAERLGYPPSVLPEPEEGRAAAA